MTCCPERTIGIVESGDFSSSLTEKRNHYLIRCGYKGNKNGYRSGCCFSDQIPRPLQDAVASSTYLDNKLANCKVNYIGNVAQSSQQYTRNLQLAAVDCGNKFGEYTRKIVAPCPRDPPEYTNSVLPKPAFIICQPPRQPTN